MQTLAPASNRQSAIFTIAAKNRRDNVNKGTVKASAIRGLKRMPLLDGVISQNVISTRLGFDTESCYHIPQAFGVEFLGTLVLNRSQDETEIARHHFLNVQQFREIRLNSSQDVLNDDSLEQPALCLGLGAHFPDTESCIIDDVEESSTTSIQVQDMDHIQRNQLNLNDIDLNYGENIDQDENHLQERSEECRFLINGERNPDENPAHYKSHQGIFNSSLRSFNFNGY